MNQLLTLLLLAAAALASAGGANAAPAPVVAAVGDVACAPNAQQTASRCRQSAVAAAIAKTDPNSVWLLGDLQYASGALSDFQNSFDASFGRFRPIWRPVVGNHEYVTSGASGYFDYFGQAAGSRSRGYYSFDIGKWHVVALNSNCAIVACDARSAQARWLRNDLKRHPRMCTAAMWHHPLYSSGGEHGSNTISRPLWKILQSRRAEIVLSGHDHDFEAFRRQDQLGRPAPRTGMQQFVVGTGGKSAYAFGPPLANTLARRTDVYGFLKLRLMPKKYSWRFVAENGQTLESGSANCR